MSSISFVDADLAKWTGFRGVVQGKCTPAKPKHLLNLGARAAKQKDDRNWNTVLCTSGTKEEHARKHTGLIRVSGFMAVLKRNIKWDNYRYNMI